jgi:nonribosomal peptide synthetase DhbF
MPARRTVGINHTRNVLAASADETTLVSMFEGQVAKAPDAVALVFKRRQMTYADLDARANQLAWSLRGDDIGPEDIVAISLERSIEMVVAIVGTLKAGAAYLPLDSAHPAERLAFMIEDARPKRVLTALRGLDSFPTTSLARSDRTTPLRDNHPAYLIYTSGSTGRPKGVLVGQRSIVQYIDLVGRVLGENCARMPLFTAPTFDLTLTTIFAPLCFGGQIRIISDTRPERALEEIFSGYGEDTGVKLTPSHISVLAGLPSNTTRLNLAIVGGEALTPAHVKTLKERCPGIRVFNEYGPTETTVGAVAGYVDTEDIHIGAPYANTRVYILDEGLQPCSISVVGELYIAGAGLARGYWNRAGLTAERFVANPFAIKPGERLYRTGDLASWRADGNLRFHGRADQQVKTRGYRIEPGEIEAALLGEPDIAQAAVIAHGNLADEKRLVAYLVPRKDIYAQPKEIDLRALRQRLAARLPEYMLPAAFVLLESLPLSPNGKLDRNGLPAPQASGLAADHVPPITPKQIVLCDLVSELLDVERVGLADNFFHLGGHSLLATRLAAQIRAVLGCELPIHAVFEHPCLGDLSQHVGIVTDSANAFNVLLPIRAKGSLPPLFCLHPIGGLCWPYVNLLRYTSEDQPIYGIQARGFADNNSLPETINEVISEVIKQIRSVSPDGPYRLLGWSFGGILAHMTATRLQVDGSPIERLVLLDSYPPKIDAELQLLDAQRPDGVWLDLAVGLDLTLPPEVVGGRLDAYTVFALARDQSHPLAALSLHQLERFAIVMANYSRFISTLEFERFRGDMLLVAATRRPRGFKGDAMSSAAWRPYCDGVIDSVLVDSTHNQMLSSSALRQMSFLATDQLR